MQDHYPTCCDNCQNPATEALLQASLQEWGQPLCRSCQANFKMKMENSIWEAISLCISLKKKGVDAELLDSGRNHSLAIHLPAYQLQVFIDLWQKNKSVAPDIQEDAALARSLHIAAPQLHAGVEATANFVAEYVRSNPYR